MAWLWIIGGAVVVFLLILFFASFGEPLPPGPTEAEKVRGRLMSRQAKDASSDVRRPKDER